MARKLEMSLFSKTIEVKSFGEVFPKKGTNARTPYEHQKQAMARLDKINGTKSYNTLVVLPTGGGKTYTATMWLLKNALDRKKKILWIAHRQMLLDQAAESFQKYAYSELIPHISSFHFRIISGTTAHDRPNDIEPTDDLLIVSKDSIGRDLESLDAWMKDEQEVFLVIDEAHHSTAKTYRKVIDYVKSKVPCVKLIGLTATPFRTAEDEKGLLAKIYSDDIAYQIGLKDLIGRQILSSPIFESYYTDENYGKSLGLNAWESIQRLDTLPDDIAKQISESAVRNRLIVNTYKAKQNVYGQTIVFAVNVVHAIQLAALFKSEKIKADYIVSDLKDAGTGASVSSADNARKIESFRKGDLQVLINVNILTEGVDLPQTKTVFLARPTVSSILMTQMIGRALRGEAAGGTSQAYIVSFIDNWSGHIAWASPETLFSGGSNDFEDSPANRMARDLRLISISKIEEFTRLLDTTVDTSALEKVPFVQRIPVGMYAFSYLEEGGVDISYQVMVYDSTAAAYKNLMKSLPDLFKSYNADDEFLPEKMLIQMEQQCHDTFFCGEMIPTYEPKDVINILKYFAQQSEAPKFYTFDEIDRNKLDVAQIAKHIWDEDMGERKIPAYLDSIWNESDSNLLRLFFGRKIYFINQVNVERTKRAHPELYEDVQNVKLGERTCADLPLYEIRKSNPALEKKLRDGAFKKAKNSKGEYQCAICGMTNRSKVYFQVDHIRPMNKGGKSVPENLQILCRKCNIKKGDH